MISPANGSLTENQTHYTSNNSWTQTHLDWSNWGSQFQLPDNHSSKIDAESAGEPTVFIENVSDAVKAVFSCVCVISVVISSISVTALRRTKRIPHAARFLSTGLLSFDAMYISSITIRKFIRDPLCNTSLQVLSSTVLQLAYVTVGLMSLERFIMFKKPMIYMQKCTEPFLRKVALTLWISTAATFQTVRYGVCFGIFKSKLVFIQAGQCIQIVTFYYSTLVLLVLVVSMFCYWSIFNIVKRQLANIEKKKISFASTANLLRTYKSTSLVLVYLLVILTTSVMYALIILYIKLTNVNLPIVRITLEIVSTINCILDPFLYVMWFKESQMEVCKLFSPLSKRLEKKAQMMKYEIFDIVTSNATPRSSYSGIDGL